MSSSEALIKRVITEAPELTEKHQELANLLQGIDQSNIKLAYFVLTGAAESIEKLENSQITLDVFLPHVIYQLSISGELQEYVEALAKNGLVDVKAFLEKYPDVTETYKSSVIEENDKILNPEVPEAPKLTEKHQAFLEEVMEFHMYEWGQYEVNNFIERQAAQLPTTKTLLRAAISYRDFYAHLIYEANQAGVINNLVECLQRDNNKVRLFLERYHNDLQDTYSA